MNKKGLGFDVFERLEISNQTLDLGDFCHRKGTLGNDENYLEYTNWQKPLRKP